jgi:hypothetical protein
MSGAVPAAIMVSTFAVSPSLYSAFHPGLLVPKSLNTRLKSLIADAGMLVMTDRVTPLRRLRGGVAAVPALPVALGLPLPQPRASNSGVIVAAAAAARRVVRPLGMVSLPPLILWCTGGDASHRKASEGSLRHTRRQPVRRSVAL